MRPLLFCLLLLSLAVTARAEGFGVALAGGVEVPVTRFGDGPDRLLWLPTEYGLRAEAHHPLAREIAAGGLEVWLADLHAGWFLAPGRSAYLEVPPEEIAELIERSRPEGGRLYLLSAGRGAALTLMALRRLQLDHADAPPLGGVFLLHPNLLAATPEPGRPARYLPVVEETNQPVYILQPLNSSKRWHLADLVERLGQGGATVYSQFLPGAADGFQARADASEGDLRERALLPQKLLRAKRLLDLHNREPRPVAAAATGGDGGWRAGSPGAGLQPYPGTPEAPPLLLMESGGAPLRLADLRGEVVLLNFWATWCPPCVEEIPSLGRLQERLAGRGFRVLGVDVGEDEATVREFLRRVPARYPVLLDPDGGMVGPWRLRAFPTTFLIDREGRIRYAYFGGLEWDSPQVVEIVEKLL